MEVRVEKDFWELFPDAKISLLMLTGVNNRYDEREKYECLLETAQEKAKEFIRESEFAQNAVVAGWRAAFQKFKTKKGVRTSIEALLKRVQNGKGVSTISPLVDIYNSVSLEFGVPCGGEDVSAIKGAMRLTLAEGDEPFITLGSDESEPPYKGEIVYKDDEGAICRCWNWRESVRTMLTENTHDAIFVIESADGLNETVLRDALDTLRQRLMDFLGGKAETAVLDRENSNYVFQI